VTYVKPGYLGFELNPLKPVTRVLIKLRVFHSLAMTRHVSQYSLYYAEINYSTRFAVDDLVDKKLGCRYILGRTTAVGITCEINETDATACHNNELLTK